MNTKKKKTKTSSKNINILNTTNTIGVIIKRDIKQDFQRIAYTYFLIFF